MTLSVPRHGRDLDKVEALHGLWLRGLPGGVRADLSGLDLSGADLSSRDLRYALFVGSRLVKASFEDTLLERADFSGADLTEAILSKADLCQANLVGASLRSARGVGANFSGADLRRARMSFAKFDGAQFKGAIFVDETPDFSGAPLLH